MSCTCGAEQVEGARFCHKCGKPQFELLSPEPEPEPVVEAPPPPPAVPPAREINFRNPTAVRIALVTSFIGYVLVSFPVPFPVVWPLIALVLAGVLAVFLYQRRTGESLSVMAGARMGWITGLFTFVIATIFLTVLVVDLQQQGGLREFYKEHITRLQGPNPELDRIFESMKDPATLASFLLLGLAIMFIWFTIFPTLGGILGAKVFERDRA